MSDNIRNVLDEIEFLTAKKHIVKRDPLPKEKYIDLLIQIKNRYDTLSALYIQAGEELSAFQALLCSANTFCEMCELELSKITANELNNMCDRLIEATAACYDFDLCRRAFVVVGHLYYYLGNYSIAQEYVEKAFDDYDYSVSTFQLYMKVLDKQCKYEKMLQLMRDYLNMRSGFHENCSMQDFFVPNMLHSLYAPTYKSLFNH